MGELGHVTVHVDDGDVPAKKKKKKPKAAAAADAEVKDDDVKVSIKDEDKAFEPIRDGIETIKAQTLALKRLDLNTTDEKGGKALAKAIEKAMTKANGAGQVIKGQLEAIKLSITTDKGKPGVTARANLYNTACKEFQTVMTDYQTTYGTVKDKTNENKRRQLKNLPTETPLSDEQIDSVIASGQEGEVMQRAMMMEDLSDLQDIVADVEERHAEILKLERSCMELLELFRDLSMLIDIQGEMLDRIDGHIQSTKKNVDNGTKKLSQADEDQMKARRKKCYLLGILIIILLVILALGGFFGGVFGKS